MKPLLIGLAMIGFLVNPGRVIAEEKTVTLDVGNMTCSLCPVTVRKALEQADGVKEAAVSYEQHRAVVIYDDKKMFTGTHVFPVKYGTVPSHMNE